MLETRIRIIDCLDAYKVLLTDHQWEIMELYYLQDFSLGEISAELEVSRQAIHDVIKRTEKVLAEYESKLGLVEQKNRLGRQMKTIVDNLQSAQPERQEYALLMCKKLLEEL